MGAIGRHADESVLSEARRLRAEEGLSTSEIARRTGLSWNTVRRRLEGVPAPSPAAPPPSGIPDTPPAPAIREDEADESRGTRTLSVVTDRPVRTLQDAIDAAEVDADTWLVDRWECSAWTVPMKVRREGEGDVPVATQQYRVKVYLRRILPRPALEAARALFERMKAHAPRYPRVVPAGRPRDPHLLEIDLFDHHFGKLAWGRETGSDYDLEVAETLWRDAVAELVDKAAGYEVEEVLLPLGNDFLHVDTAQNTTTSGTPQDTDGRLCKIIETAKAAAIWAVEYLAARYPRVRVVCVPGNHDRIMSFCLAHMVDAWFHHADHVEVDASPRHRKRVRYGVNLIGFTHGDMRNTKGLPALMAQEWPDDWAATRFREWHLGHVHHERRFTTQPVDTVDGVVVRYLRSLCGVDSWHYREGYVGSPRAAECYLWSRDRGPSGMFYAYAGRDGGASKDYSIRSALPT